MSADEVVFQLVNQCECCHKLIGRHDRAVVICKFPDGGSDTICRDCYVMMTQGCLAWYAYDGNLPKESQESRLQRARDTAEHERAITLLEGIIFA